MQSIAKHCKALSVASYRDLGPEGPKLKNVHLFDIRLQQSEQSSGCFIGF